MDTNLADNSEGGISALDLRQVNESLIKKVGGWVDYNNGEAGLQSITASTWTALTNDGLGAYTDTSYKPYYLSGDWWSSNAIQLDEIEVGAFINCRFDITLGILSNNTDVQFRIHFMNSSEETIFSTLFDYRAFKTTGTLSGVNTFDFYVGASLEGAHAHIEVLADQNINAKLNGVVLHTP